MEKKIRKAGVTFSKTLPTRFGKRKEFSPHITPFDSDFAPSTTNVTAVINGEMTHTFFPNPEAYELESQDTPETQPSPTDVVELEPRAFVRRKSDYSLASGIDALINRLAQIEDECTVHEKEIKGPKPRDRFVEVKNEMYQIVQTVRNSLRTREKEVRLRGNTVAAIKLKFDAETNIRLLEKMFLTLKSEFVHQSRIQKIPMKPRRIRHLEDIGVQDDLTTEEMDFRKRDVEVLSRIISELVLSNIRATSAPKGDFESEMRFIPSNPSPSGSRTNKSLTKEEQSALRKWQQKDEQIEAELVGLSESIESLECIAIRIGQSAEMQNEVAEATKGQTIETSSKLVEIQIKMKAAMAKQNQSRFWARLGLMIVLVCLLSAIGALVSKKPFAQKLTASLQ